jgi:stearoyl-CoA desaturase (delta-9 desaturase)
MQCIQISCRSINPAENLAVALGAIGEGWHNYHHTFPWDYRTSELGKYATNITLVILDYMAAIGQVYDRKFVSEEMIQKRCSRTGDGTHPVWKPENKSTSTKLE